jgi:hypothetical protein
VQVHYQDQVPAEGTRGGQARCGSEARARAGGLSSHGRADPVSGWLARRDLAEVRRLIHEADPDIMEECKWVKPNDSTIGVFDE